MRAVLMTWNLPEEQLGRLRYLCLRTQVQLRPVTPAECTLPLKDLKDRAAPADAGEAPFTAPMLLMCGFTGPQADALLDTVRPFQPPIRLKAVLTPTNRRWNSLQLYEELSRERSALEGN